MLIKMMWIAILALTSPRTVQGSIFGAHDKWNPEPALACSGKPVDDRTLVIALKTGPCGAQYLVCNPHGWQCVVAVRLEWGPVHRGLDMTQGVADSIGFSGNGPVLYQHLPWLGLTKKAPRSAAKAKRVHRRVTRS